MITNIIFSKDRGLQLDALLRSLEQHSSDLFDNVVIYTHTNEKYRKGYNIIKKRHRDTKFVFERDLKKDILKHMDNGLISFMVDDMIMFKECSLNQYPMLPIEECFSLRLGNNVVYPHINYPLSLDGHIYGTDDIKPLIESIEFNNPNELESKLQRFKKDWNTNYKYQCTISIPHNRVSSKSHCKFSGLYPTDVLNRYLLDGFIIDYDKMDFGDIDNVHALINYKFKSI